MTNFTSTYAAGLAGTKQPLDAVKNTFTRIRLTAFFSLLFLTFFADYGYTQDFNDTWHVQIPSRDDGSYGYSEYEASLIAGDTLYLFSEFYGDSLEVDPGAGVEWIDDEYNTGLSGIIFVSRYLVSTGDYLGSSKLIEIPADANGSMTVMGIYDYEVSASGKITVVGDCVSGVDFDGTMVSGGLYGSAPAISFVSFYESDGTYLGHVEYDLNYTGTPYSSAINDGFFINQVEFDQDENCYIFGSILGTVDMDFSAGIDLQTSEGNFDCALLKIDGTSNSFSWSHHFGGASSENIYYTGISNNQLVMVGTYGSGSMDLNPGAGSFNVSNPMTCCDWVFFLRMDFDGSFINGGAIGGDTDISLDGFKTDVDGNSYLMGHLDADIPFDLDPTSEIRDPEYQSFIVTYDAGFSTSEVASFENSYSFENFEVSPYYLALYGYFDPGESLIVQSSFDGSQDTITAGSEGGMFVVPMNKTTSSLGTPAIYPFLYNRYAYAYTGTTDAEGNFYFSGYFKDAIDFDPFDGMAVVDSATFASSNVPDVFVARLGWDGFVGMEEAGSTNRVLKVYPNPSTSTLSIESPQGISSVQVTDLTGRLVYQMPASDQQLVLLDLANEPAGYYLVQVITSAGERHIEKVVKR